MTTNDKYKKLVRLLIKKSEEGSAEWEPTLNDSAFLLAFPSYGVQITRIENGERNDVVFHIINDQGRILDSFTDAHVTDGPGSLTWAAILTLYEMARRQALGADAALNHLIDELEK